MARRLHMLLGVTIFATLSETARSATSKSVPFLEQSFAFDYAPSSQDPPIPITEQCEIIHISWGRQGFTTGPNPVAPYYLQIYTSAYIFPIVIPTGDPSTRTFDWAVPFAPGTQYQICMFDSNGASGGCQRMYTVIPSRTVTDGSTPNCANLTFPASTLPIQGLVTDGPLSQFGWVPSCSDISIKPLNGTPPFTLTVAPTLHPVWNITSETMDAINWTVQLSWASPFFISLVDANGESWSNGPLHSGKGTDECLSSRPPEKNRVPESIAVGSGVGGLVAGSVLGVLASWCLFRRRASRYGWYDGNDSTERIHSIGMPKTQGHSLDVPGDPGHYTPLPAGGDQQPSHNNTVNSQRAPRLHRLASPGSGYEVEPFRLPPPEPVAESTGQDTMPLSPTVRSEPSQDSQHRNLSHVYVVHHDAGRAPVTVYTPDGTEVIELPPRYTGEGSNPGQRPNAEGATPTKPTLTIPQSLSRSGASS